MEAKTEKLKIGELLVKEGYITSQQLEEALAEQREGKVEEYMPSVALTQHLKLGAEKGKSEGRMPLGEVCVKLKFITRYDLRQILRKYQKNIYLGEIMLNLGLVTEEQIEEALEIQKLEEKRLGKVLVEHGFVSESNLVDTLSTQLGIPKIMPNVGLIDQKILAGVGKAFLLKNECLPAFKDGNILTVIMSDPLSEETIRTMENLFRCKVEPAIATSDDILKTIRLIYGELKSLVKTGEEGPAPALAPGTGIVIGDTDISVQTKDDVIGIVNFIISNAVMEGATDIHLDPQENRLRVRYRIDGLLRHKTDLPLYLAPTLASRLKAICGLDIADRRRHQDGRIRAQVMKKEFDLRVSTFASILGESIAIRVLPRQISLTDIEMLGFSPVNLNLFKKILDIPSGIVMITGPSGSGKTTTLYSAIGYLNNMDKKVITVEDPVEYRIEGVVQGQISEKAGLTYMNFLKSMLRQDPDVIMVGDVRDKESAEAVVETALTGNKVLTSFHTDDASSALLRLMEIGIETFLISSTLISVVSQRLVRLLCPFCKEPYVPGDQIPSFFGSIRPFNAEKYTFYTSRGCLECDNTGFKGRAAVHEILLTNNKIRDAILARMPSGKIRTIARQSAGLISMREDGFYKATKGITSLEEIIRTVSYDESDDLTPRSSEDVVALCEENV